MSELPVLPLRDAVLFPENLLPVHVGRDRSLNLIDEVVQNEQDIVILAQKDPSTEHPDEDDLYDVGCRASVIKILDRTATPQSTETVLIKGEERVQCEDITQTDPFIKGEFTDLQEKSDNDAEERRLADQLREKIVEIGREVPDLPDQAPQILDDVKDRRALADIVASNLNDLDIARQQELLETLDVKERLRQSIHLLEEQVELAEAREAVEEETLKRSREKQEEYVLRQKLRSIKEQLGELSDSDGLREKVEEMKLPERVERICHKQLDRLDSMQPSSSEYSVAVNYIETLLDIPWGIHTEDNLNLDQAERTLENDHYGLEEVKERIIEHLAVQNLRDSNESPIICLVGPPGVGKTSLGKSVARTMGREFRRISLGGIYDESEIRGHRRTYVGSLPGKIIRSLIKTGTMNPVFMLDEIDKIGNDFRGDPEAALLEVLDPEQNDEFEDHYVETPVDLSKVFFITTANHLEPISAPLRDRMEIIKVPSYTNYEKKQIAQRHLMPKQVQNNGITEDLIDIEDDAMDLLIERYTDEAGVRTLERKLDEVCRKVAVDYLHDDSSEDEFQQTVDEGWIVDHLGPEEYESKMAQRTSIPGVSAGLAWTKTGGDVLFVETQITHGDGELHLTGSLGDVMKESVHAAMTYIKSRSDRFNLPDNLDENIDLHVHFPKGAIPKDGPSAGITVFSSILSALTETEVREEVAMTGEITLRGSILKVGGIKEKVTAAHRAGIEEVILPESCRNTLEEEVHDDIKDDLEFHFVERVRELPELVFEDPDFEDEDHSPLLLSRSREEANA